MVGSVLIAAAVLKLTGWNVSAFAQYGWLLTPSVQIAAVGWELLLGTCLILGIHRSLTWIFAVVTFAAFAAVSSYLGIIGQASCGCFGTIEASPWTAFAVDVGALVLLGVSRPSFNQHPVERSVLLRVATFAAATAVLLTFLNYSFGSLDTVLAKLRGQPFEASPSVLDFGSDVAGVTIQRTITVKNYKNSPLRLVGGTSDCSCLVTQDLPITIPENSEAEVTIKLRLPAGKEGEMARLVEIYTDDPAAPKISLRAVARVLASADYPPR